VRNHTYSGRQVGFTYSRTAGVSRAGICSLCPTKVVTEAEAARAASKICDADILLARLHTASLSCLEVVGLVVLQFVRRSEVITALLGADEIRV